MKAIAITRYGGPEVLEVAERPIPQVGRGQVLVRVVASCVNPRDWLVREGRYVFGFMLPAMPFVPGSDIAGEVVEVGPAVESLRVGDAVFGMQPLRGGMGAYAQFVAMDADALALKPATTSFEEAAAVPCAGLTAWGALHRIAAVGPGDRVVINGASGGVGTYAVQIAKALGAHVSAISSAGNHGLCLSLGADEVIDYNTQDPLSLLRDVSVFFDVIGRSSLAKTRSCLREGGRYITTIPSLPTLGTAVGSGLRRAFKLGDGKSAHMVLVRAHGKDLEALGQLMAANRLRSVIEAVYPLEEAPAAHQRSRSWRVRGKLVLRID
ncbi:MAG: NAD(P)-dependent alcohol dehydrogenase [Pseudomonadota bacterium]